MIYWVVTTSDVSKDNVKRVNTKMLNIVAKMYASEIVNFFLYVSVLFLNIETIANY